MNFFTLMRAARYPLMAEAEAPAATGGAPDAAPPAATGDTLLTQLNADPADKPADAAPADTETPEAKAARETAEAKANEVPETYADFTMPEGVEVDTAMLTEFSSVAKELGLTQAQAQKLVDLQAKSATGEAANRTAQLEQALAKQSETWVSELKNDPGLGGAKYDQTISTAVKAVSTFFGDDFRQLLNESGLGNNPALVRGLYKIGMAISEDKMVIPGSDSSITDDKSTAEVMFGDVNFKNL